MKYPVNFIINAMFSIARILIHACELTCLACDGNTDTSQYMLLSNKLSTIIDLLSYRIDVSTVLYNSFFLHYLVGFRNHTSVTNILWTWCQWPASPIFIIFSEWIWIYWWIDRERLYRIYYLSVPTQNAGLSVWPCTVYKKTLLVRKATGHFMKSACIKIGSYIRCWNRLWCFV